MFKICAKLSSLYVHCFVNQCFLSNAQRLSHMMNNIAPIKRSLYNPARQGSYMLTIITGLIPDTDRISLPISLHFVKYFGPVVRTLAVPITESPSSIDIHGVKRDLDKIHWCILNHLTQSSMGARTFKVGDSAFLYTGIKKLIGCHHGSLVLWQILQLSRNALTTNLMHVTAI